MAIQSKSTAKRSAAPRKTGKRSGSVPAKPGAAAPTAVALDQSDEIARESIRLSFLIHDVSRMRRAAYDQFMKPLGITRAQWWVLAHLSRHDGMMQTQLADVLEVGKASLGDVISGLEAGGWIERRSDPADKRARRVFLTRASQSLLKRMTAMENQFNEQILGGLSLRERRDAAASLLKIKTALARFGQAASADDFPGT